MKRKEQESQARKSEAFHNLQFTSHARKRERYFAMMRRLVGARGRVMSVVFLNS